MTLDLHPALKEALIRYEKARVQYLKARDSHLIFDQPETLRDWIIAKEGLKLEIDRMVAGWRDLIHECLNMIGNEPRLLHGVMDAMQEFINRSKA